MMKGTDLLTIAAVLSMIAAMLHIGIIFGGPDWYRFFGAGERMAQLAETGSLRPTITTLIVAGVLASWAAYALSGAGHIVPLPFIKTVLVLITSVFLLRGIAGLVLPFVSNHPFISQNSLTFWMVSSVICCIYACFYLFGTLLSWQQLR